MNSSIVNSLLNGRMQHVAAMYSIVRHFVKTFLMPTTSGVSRGDWLSRPRSIDPKARLFDLPTAFFCALARSYDVVVEVGAADGERILAIKEVLPAIKAYGLDLSTDYEPTHDVSGVTFIRFTPENFETLPDGALVIAVGTLTYFEPGELKSWLAVLRQKRMSLAFFELSPLFSFSSFIRRRVNGGRYYAYKIILTEAGFASAIPKGSRWNHLGIVRRLEQWTYDYFVPAEVHREVGTSRNSSLDGI